DRRPRRPAAWHLSRRHRAAHAPRDLSRRHRGGGPAPGGAMFERLTWLPDRALLDDLVFRLEQSRSDDWELGDECFAFYKNRQLVEQFDSFWSATGFRPRRMLEIGIWDGGSTAFWFEHLRPERLLAIDLRDREDSPYFRRWVAANGLAGRVLTRWRTDQGDRAALRELVERDLGGELDLVIDDGSHQDVPTRASFETLFPLLPPGGLYVIEDWAWEHWPEFQDPGHIWAGEESLSALVCDLVAATGSSRTLIRDLSVYEGVVVGGGGGGGRHRPAGRPRRPLPPAPPRPRRTSRSSPSTCRSSTPFRRTTAGGARGSPSGRP